MASPEESRELSISENPVAGALERFDLADDTKIIESLSKRVATGFTYKVNGKHGLSSAGTLWAVREFAKQGEVYRVIGDVEIKVCPIDPDYVNVTLKVQRFFVNPGTGQEIALDSTIGHKRMSRKAKRYLDENDKSKFEMVEDPEFTTKAITKAERNGKLKLMPKDAVVNLIAKALGQGQSAQGGTRPAPKGPPGRPSAPPPPPTPTPPAAHTAPPPPSPSSPPAPPPQSAPAATAPPAATVPPPPPKMTREVMIQKLDAVSKLVFQTPDGAQARAKLAQLTGKASPSDIPDEEMKTVGNAINAVANKKAKLEGNNIIRIADGVVLWKGPAAAAPPQPPPEEPPAEEEMF